MRAEKARPSKTWWLVGLPVTHLHRTKCYSECKGNMNPLEERITELENWQRKVDSRLEQLEAQVSQIQQQLTPREAIQRLEDDLLQEIADMGGDSAERIYDTKRPILDRMVIVENRTTLLAVIIEEMLRYFNTANRDLARRLILDVFQIPSLDEPMLENRFKRLTEGTEK